jgi:hypothetical protein
MIKTWICLQVKFYLLGMLLAGQNSPPGKFVVSKMVNFWWGQSQLFKHPFNFCEFKAVQIQVVLFLAWFTYFHCCKNTRSTIKFEAKKDIAREQNRWLYSLLETSQKYFLKFGLWQVGDPILLNTIYTYIFAKFSYRYV